MSYMFKSNARSVEPVASSRRLTSRYSKPFCSKNAHTTFLPSTSVKVGFVLMIAMIFLVTGEKPQSRREAEASGEVLEGSEGEAR